MARAKFHLRAEAELDRFVQGFERPRDVAGVAERYPEIVPGFGMGGLLFDGLAEGLNGTVQITRGAEGVAEIVVAIGEIRREPHSFPSALNSFDGFTLRLEGKAEVAPKDGAQRIEADGCAERVLCFDCIAHAA